MHYTYQDSASKAVLCLFGCCQGYFKKDEYIVTQHPLADTVADFWRMVWDQNTMTVVLLSPVDDVRLDDDIAVNAFENSIIAKFYQIFCTTEMLYVHVGFCRRRITSNSGRMRATSRNTRTSA